MNAREFLKSKGAEWDIDNYTEMWVPGDKLSKILEEYYTHRSKENAEVRYNRAIRFLKSLTLDYIDQNDHKNRTREIVSVKLCRELFDRRTRQWKWLDKFIKIASGKEEL